MNKLFLKLGLAAVMAMAALTVFTPKAEAQLYGPWNATLGSNYLAASSASNQTFFVDMRYNRNLAINFQVQGDAAGTAAVTTVWRWSLDNVTYDTTKDILFVAAANGTTKVNTLTNFDAFAFGYFKLIYVTNAAATMNVTNMSIQVAIKPPPN